MISRSDAVDGWRDRRTDGGLGMDVAFGEVVACGFSMPHSPRLVGDRLCMVNSGTGQFGYVDNNAGVFEEISFCTGVARGL